MNSSSAEFHTGWCARSASVNLPPVMFYMFYIDLHCTSTESPPLWVYCTHLRLLQALG